VRVRLGDGRGGMESLEPDRLSSLFGGFFNLQFRPSYNWANPMASVTVFGLSACSSILTSLLSPFMKQPNCW
jgi:hypothetical protein